MPGVDAARLLGQRGLRDLPSARNRMVAWLAARGIDARVRGALSLIPRHAFAPRPLAARAYLDCYLYTERTVLTQPFMVALMTQYLELDPTKTVLEIGTGTGYHTALLAVLARHVFTIERVPALVHESAEALAALGLGNVSQRTGDGHRGWPDAAPFDAILLTAAPPAAPVGLARQLRPGSGRMVVPVGPAAGGQRLWLIRRRPDGVCIKRDLGSVCFVPLVPAAAGASPRPNSAGSCSRSAGGGGAARGRGRAVTGGVR